MRCPRCRQENRPEAKFCAECAAPLTRTCPNCGTQVSPSAKFCSECAHPLDTPAAPRPRFASPDTYTPKDLAERILTSKVAFEGEHKKEAELNKTRRKPASGVIWKLFGLVLAAAPLIPRVDHAGTPINHNESLVRDTAK